MLGKTASEGTYKDQPNPNSPPLPADNPNKNYKNYINFQGSSQTQPRQSQRDPDHVAMYTLNVSPHPNPKRQTQNTPTINRNPYINGPIQLRKDPPKQNPSRYSNNKQQFPCRQSQELTKNKTEMLKPVQKSNSISSKGLNSSLNHYMNKTNTQPPEYPDLANNAYNYNQTVDLGSISRNQSIAQSVATRPQEELLRQKLNYLEFLQQSINQFENTQSVRALQNLNQNNRRLLQNYYQEICRQRQQRSRKTISDCISQSDNMSEDAFSVDVRSDYTSLSIHTDKNRVIDSFNRSREKSVQRDGELAGEMKLHDKLEKQYNELMNAGNKNANQLLKIETDLKNVSSECSKLSIKNNEIKQKLSKFPFYQEWILMSDEAEGAKKTQIRLKQQLKKRKGRLVEIKQEGNKDGSVSSTTNKRKSQQASSREKPEEQKERVSSLNKNIPTKPKMQSIPMPIRPLDSSQGESSAARIIQDSSLRMMGVNQPARNKSINRPPNIL